ncbi:toll-like receptor [Plakobranchus ocellatus]|uniref:Toll-like receptor n=1 Tax=Plakobranchus ocellatus TaxID=259542 RepID=A0AAV4C6J2_9GAST|nr:toll-like receptor [Plakobranchus ocellatus]
MLDETKSLEVYSSAKTLQAYIMEDTPRDGTSLLQISGRVVLTPRPPASERPTFGLPLKFENLYKKKTDQNLHEKAGVAFFLGSLSPSNNSTFVSTGCRTRWTCGPGYEPVGLNNRRGLDKYTGGQKNRMAAGVSIKQTRPRPLLISLVVGMIVLVSGVKGVAYPYGSDLLGNESPQDIICPDGCACHVDNKNNSSPIVSLQCGVFYFEPQQLSRILRRTDLRQFTYALFSCTWDDTGLIAKPESSLWTNAFSGLENLRTLVFYRCAFKSIPNDAFEGLSQLTQLIIHGASISVLDSEFLKSIPQLKELHVIASGLTLLPALCQTGLNIRVLNLSSNALTSFDAAGVRCVDSGVDGRSAGPPLIGLETLDLRHNAITAWPSWLGNSLPGLFILAVGHNRISSFGDSPFSGLSHITNLDLVDTSISAFDTRFFRNANQYLNILRLSHNHVNQLPYGLLSQLSHLKHLEMSDMLLGSNVWIHLGHLVELRHLDLSDNLLRSLRQDVLSNMVNLEHLNLVNNQLTKLPDAAFVAQNGLIELHLSHNRLEKVPAGALRGARHLRSLYLDHNDMYMIERGAFDNNTHLVSVDLSNNKLTSLPSRLLAHQRELQHFDSSYNQLAGLENDAFSQNYNLASLNISHNKLSRLPAGPFPNTLKSIDFGYNLASSPLSSLMLNGLTNVTEIRLNNNRLSSLPLTMFTSCMALKYLDLSHNIIKEVEESMFTGTKSLTEIDFSDNQLEDIGTAFSGIEKLQVLNLSRNKLSAITHGQFPHYIEQLDLSKNLIESIKDRTFKSLTRIKTVDLRDNQLKRINRMDVAISYNIAFAPEFFLQFNPLECDCHLGWLKDWYMGTLNDMKTLPTFKSLDRVKCSNPFATGSTSLASLDRSSFLCEYRKFCEKECMCREFKACYCCYECPAGCRCVRGDRSMKLQRVECQAVGLSQFPENLPEGATEVRLDGNFFSSIPDLAFKASRQAQVVYLNNSNIQTINNSTFTGLKSLRRLYLHNNFLTEISEAFFEPLDNLEELFLHNNELFLIEPRALLAPPLLRTLTLNRNSLVTLPLDDLWALVNRTSYSDQYSPDSRNRRDTSALSLSLSRNPWSCEPGFVCKFLTFLQANSETVGDLQYIECVPEPQVVAVVPESGPALGDATSGRSSVRPTMPKNSPGRKVLDLQMDVCWTGPARHNKTDNNITVASADTGESDRKMYSLIAGCVLIALFLILLVAIVLNRHLLQVLCYTRCGCRMRRPGKEEEKRDAAAEDRPYDAFICHSNKDTEFVLQELAPKLENGDKQFRLCVHYRDFPVGANLGDAIARSVKASKRTILVLSENFLESEYCKFEFQAAHQQVMSEKHDRRLIILLLGDLDPAKVNDSALKIYLRTRTYLKVGERWFWEKLIFAMPDITTRHPRRRHSGGKGEPGDAAAVRLPSTRDLEYMDRERRMSEQQQIDQQHLFELQQQQQQRQQLLLQQQQQQQQQLLAHAPLIQYRQDNHPHLHHQHHHPHYLHQHNHHPHFSPPNYQEQHPQPHHQQVLFHPHPHQPYNHQQQPRPQQQQQQPQQQQQQQQLVNHMASPRHDMYEIPALDAAPTPNYHLAKNGGPQNLNFLRPGHGGSPMMTTGQGRSGEGGSGSVSGRESFESTHVNTAFHNSDDSSTSGYHNGSDDCCTVCGSHYEEVGPGSTSVMTTPSKITDYRSPPPLPVIPKEGFVPYERHVALNT